MFLCLLNGVVYDLMLKSKEGTCEVCEVVTHGSRGILLLRIDPTDDSIDVTIIILDQLYCCFKPYTV
jgi:hypothetical protein